MRTLLLLLFFSITTNALDTATADIATSQTSDQIDIFDLNTSYQKARHDLFWPYQNQVEKNSFGLNFNHRGVEGPAVDAIFLHFEGNYEFNGLLKNTSKVILKTGFLTLDENKIDHDSSHLTYGLHYQFTKNNWFISSELSKTNAYQRSLILTGNPVDLNSNAINFMVRKNIFQNKITVQAKWFYDDLNDENIRQDMDFEIMYSFMTYPHWIRAGFGYQNLSFNNSNPTYWSPEKFYSYGPRVDVSLDLKYVNFVLGGNYVWFEENELFDGSGFYLRTGLSKGIREDYQIQFFFEKNESLQNNNTWTADAFRLVLHIAW